MSKKPKDMTEKIRNTSLKQEAMVARFDELIKAEPKARFISRSHFYQEVAEEYFCSAETVMRAVMKHKVAAKNA